jgi:predicted nuclease with TOPRIM domain
MAQDFYAAFKVGPDDKHITTVDEGGVALAAIQGLNQKLQEKDARLNEELNEKDAEIKALEKRMSDLEAEVKASAQK